MIKLIKIIVIIKQTRMNVHLSQGNKNNPIGAVLVNKHMDLTMNHINHCKYRIWHWNSVYEIVYYRCPILNRQCHFTRSILNVFLEVMFSRLWGCQRNPHRFGWCAGKLSRSAYSLLVQIWIRWRRHASWRFPQWNPCRSLWSDLDRRYLCVRWPRAVQYLCPETCEIWRWMATVFYFDGAWSQTPMNS